jgi:hypothetical protein
MVRKVGRAGLAALVVSGVTAFVGIAQAQTLQLALDQAPYYTDVPIEVQITAEGFSEEPQPEIEAHGPAAAFFKLVGVSPNVSRSVTIVNGRMTQRSSVRFVYSYRFSPPKPGRYQIGPFRVTQGGTTKVSGLTNITVEEIATSAGQRVRVDLPSGDIYVGQRIPVQVQWWVSPELRGTLFTQRIIVPMLDLEQVFAIDSVVDTDANGNALRSKLIITVAGTPAEYPAREETRKENGVEYIVRVTDLVVVALAPATYDLAPPTVTVDQAISWRRDLFGGRVPAKARKIRAVGQRRTLRVLDVPSIGRPNSFAGAVGSGFTIDVAADRSVVQVGDPITLWITLYGEGSIESAAPPNLIGSHALPARDFRVVREPTAGQYEDGAKRFEAVIRVNNASVSEIPPIEFAWFDPEAVAFHSQSSRPIALSVKDARIVGAGDVVRNIPDEGETPAAGDVANNPSAAQGPASPLRPTFTLTGADLAIERGLSKLSSSGRSELWQWACYGLGLLFLGVATARRSRGEVDPKLAALRKALLEERNLISKATSAGEIADALRRMASHGEITDRSGLESLLADCDAIAYARDRATAPVDAALKDRALMVAETITELSR